jgi:hypothetical protein
VKYKNENIVTQICNKNKLLEKREKIKSHNLEVAVELWRREEIGIEKS